MITVNGKFHWAKLWRYPHYMEFRGITSVVQGQHAYMMVMLIL